MLVTLNKGCANARDAFVPVGLNSHLFRHSNKYRPFALNRYKLLSLKKENVFRYGFSIFPLAAAGTRARNMSVRRNVALRLDLLTNFTQTNIFLYRSKISRKNIRWVKSIGFTVFSLDMKASILTAS